MAFLAAQPFSATVAGTLLHRATSHNTLKKTVNFYAPNIDVFYSTFEREFSVKRETKILIDMSVTLPHPQPIFMPANKLLAFSGWGSTY